MSRYLDIDDDRNFYIGSHGEYEIYNIHPDVLAEAITELDNNSTNKEE